MRPESDPRGADPDVLRRRDLLRQRRALRQGCHGRRSPLSASQDGLRRRPDAERAAVRAEALAALLARRAAEVARRNEAAGRLLDVGCSDGRVRRRSPGPSATTSPASTSRSTKASASASTASSRPTSTTACPCELGGQFDYVVAADVLEHTIAPEPCSPTSVAALASTGLILVSVPNFAHWYPRPRVALGRFDYDHAACSIAVTSGSSPDAASNGCSMTAVSRSWCARSSASPIADVLDAGASRRRVASSEPRRPSTARGPVWPTMFGYQFLYVLRPKARPPGRPATVADHLAAARLAADVTACSVPATTFGDVWGPR